MRRVVYLISVNIAIIIAGCAVDETYARSKPMAPAQVGVVNHTGNFIYSASADGAGGGGMDAWGAASANMCCVSIPEVWYPGVKVVVRWDMPEGHTHIVKEKIVEIERYDQPGSIYMNFFPNDEVRVIVSRVGPRHPAYPIHHVGNPNETPSSD